jgi:hypothetical protein
VEYGRGVSDWFTRHPHVFGLLLIAGIIGLILFAQSGIVPGWKN